MGRATACGLTGIEADIRRRFGFKVTDHSLEFFGSCQECRKKEETK